MKEEDHPELQEAWNAYWAYFTRTWLHLYHPKTWNIHHILNNPTAKEELLNRTNNPLERYNRKLNEDLQPHSPMLVFIDGIKAHAHAYIQKIKDIERGLKAKPTRKPTIPSIPPAYHQFRSATLLALQEKKKNTRHKRN